MGSSSNMVTKNFYFTCWRLCYTGWQKVTQKSCWLS